MNTKTLQNPEEWAVETFGAAELGDVRRTDRLVKLASALGENPSVSLPASMRNWGDTHAAYQFLGNPAISHEQIMAPHFAGTYQEAAERSQVLLIGDTTEVNLSTHKATSGLGPVGRGNKAKGFFVHSVLAVDAKDKQLLGCMGQEPFVREPAPEKETRAERNKRWRESLIWERSIERIGPVPANTQWIYVGDRGSDIFRFWQRCEELGYDHVTRVAQNRNVLVEEEDECEDQTAKHLKTLARSLPAQGAMVMAIPAQHGRPERDALVNISWSPVAIQPPVDGTALHMTPVKASLVRVWEPEPPEGVEALEWILVTSVTVNTTEDAWQRVMWYKWRWFVEDFHTVLKTGCLLEDRCLQTVEAMCNLLAILTPTAMRLLWLRQTAQTAPDTPATQVISKEVRWSCIWTNDPRPHSPPEICGARLPALVATSTAKVIHHRDGRPYGKAGYAFRPSSKAFISHVSFLLDHLRISDSNVPRASSLNHQKWDRSTLRLIYHFFNALTA